MKNEDLFDEIIANPFGHIAKTLLSCSYRSYTKSDGTTGNIPGVGYFKGVVEYAYKSEMSKLDSISISDGSKHITLQRDVLISIELDCGWQKRKNEFDQLIEAVSNLAKRILNIEMKLKDLGD